jgi:hypothetical protein
VMDHPGWDQWPEGEHPDEHPGGHPLDGSGYDDLGHGDLGHGDFGSEDYAHELANADTADLSGPTHELDAHDGYPEPEPGPAHDAELGYASELSGHDLDPGHPGEDPGHLSVDPGHLSGAVDPDPLAGHEAPPVFAADERIFTGYPTEHLVGADPDLAGADQLGSAGGLAGLFPPALELAIRPTPLDGYPWTDPDALGRGELLDHPAPTGFPGTGGGYPPADPFAGGGEPVPAGDLFAYAGMTPPPAGVDPWSALLAADDPATSALARWWSGAG